MTGAEIMKYVPHPKRCMADEFDKVGVQCPNPREAFYYGMSPFDNLVDGTIRVHVCMAHDTYRKNGGPTLGPILLRAIAESYQKLKRDTTPSKRRSSSSPS